MKFQSASLLFITLLATSAACADETHSGRPSIHGTVTDANGEPLQGVRVDVATAAPKVGRGIFCPSCYRDCGKSTTTDADGHFLIEQLDPSLKFRLICTMPGRRTLGTDLIDPADGAVSLSLEEFPDDLDPKRVVSGVVVQNGVPVAGALVEPHGARTAGRRWWGKVDGVSTTVTDTDGKFVMPLPDEFLAIEIEITGPGLCGEQLILEPGQDAVTVEARVGANVIGRLAHNGKPVAGMSIAVVQLERSVSAGIFIAAVGDVTDGDGRFEFQHLPPDQRYCIYSIAGEAKQSKSPFIVTTKTFTVPGSSETRDLGPLEIANPLSIRGRVVNVDGQPLPEHLQLSFGRDPAWDLIGIPVEEDGSFVATGLPPEAYEIRVGDRELVVVAEEIPFQILSDASFGIRLRNSIDDLVIPVRRKE